MEDYSTGPANVVPNSCQCWYSSSINQAMSTTFAMAKSAVVEPNESH